jgi:outer membrane lipoprotein-sorting protein
MSIMKLPLRPAVMPSFRTLCTLPLLALLLIFVTACGSKRTPENLAKIKNGMKSAEVRAILGKPDRIETATILGLEGTTFFYEKGDARVQISFINDEVTVKLGSFNPPQKK